jgi:hypothetical protein
VTTANGCPISVCAGHEMMDMLSDPHPVVQSHEVCNNLLEGYDICDEQMLISE